MNAHRRLMWLVSSLIAALVGISAAAEGSAQAVTQSMSISSQAGVTASGAGLTLQLNVNCPKGATFSTNASVTQRFSSTEAATGSGASIARPCTGTAQTQRVGIAATKRPFIVGPAFVSTTAAICDDQYNCVPLKAARTVSAVSLTLNQANYTSGGFSLGLPPTGTVEAKGAGALVRVPYRCDPGTFGDFTGRLVERTAGYVYTGQDYFSVECTSSNRTGVLAFHAVGPFWHAGPVFVLVDANYLCTPTVCGSGQSVAFRTLTLVRPT